MASLLHSPTQPALQPTRCAICDTLGNATEVYPANFDLAALNPRVFSARRLPDRVHYRIVRCDDCGLLRSDPVADSRLLDELYARSSFDYAAEVPYVVHTYAAYLDRLRRLHPAADSLLEIGCGNGFLLAEARRRGIGRVAGVEPSAHAVAQASDDVRPHIVCDVLRPGLFADGSFELVCLFQVFDHIADPAALLGECLRVLRPGGLLLCLNHNVEAISARLLGRRSPIIDIEHTYLYSPATMRRLFARHGFEVVEAGPVWNRLSVQHLARLVPLPAALKRPLLALLCGSRVGRLPCRLPLGNLYQIALKPGR